MHQSMHVGVHVHISVRESMPFIASNMVFDSEKINLYPSLPFVFVTGYSPFPFIKLYILKTDIAETVSDRFFCQPIMIPVQSLCSININFF